VGEAHPTNYPIAEIPMKYGLFLSIAIVALTIINAGCQSRHFVNVGKDSKGNEYGVPANSIDGYAKSHGVSREEAVSRMRADLVPPNVSMGTPEQGNEALK
jgi:hypothetical protein